MRKVKSITAAAVLPVLLFAPDLATAHGERHPGNHGGASECVKPIRITGVIGGGYWENSCSYGVHVKWAVLGEGVGCRPASYSPLTCIAFVPANSRRASTISHSGTIRWIACRAKDGSSDPWPVVLNVRADERIEFGCYHLGFTPQRSKEKVRRVDRIMRTAKRANVRTGPGTNYAKSGLLAVGEVVRVTGEMGNWRRIRHASQKQDAFVYAPLLAPVRSRTGSASGARGGADNRLTTRTITYSGGGRYRGQTLNGRPHGRGVYAKPDGFRYEGDFRNGVFHGHGVEVRPDGSRYEGGFRNGKYHGRGVETDGTGWRFEGQFVDGTLHGRAMDILENGVRVELRYVNGKEVTGRGRCAGEFQHVQDNIVGCRRGDDDDCDALYLYAKGGEYGDVYEYLSTTCDIPGTRELLSLAYRLGEHSEQARREKKRSATRRRLQEEQRRSQQFRDMMLDTIKRASEQNRRRQTTYGNSYDCPAGRGYCVDK